MQSKDGRRWLRQEAGLDWDMGCGLRVPKEAGRGQELVQRLGREGGQALRQGQKLGPRGEQQEQHTLGQECGQVVGRVWGRPRGEEDKPQALGQWGQGLGPRGEQALHGDDELTGRGQGSEVARELGTGRWAGHRQVPQTGGPAQQKEVRPPTRQTQAQTNKEQGEQLQLHNN